MLTQHRRRSLDGLGGARESDGLAELTQPGAQIALHVFDHASALGRPWVHQVVAPIALSADLAWNPRTVQIREPLGGSLLPENRLQYCAQLVAVIDTSKVRRKARVLAQPRPIDRRAQAPRYRSIHQPFHKSGNRGTSPSDCGSAWAAGAGRNAR